MICVAVAAYHRLLCSFQRTSDLGVGSLLAITNIDKIKGRFGLGKTQCKLLKHAGVVNAAIATKGLAQAGDIGYDAANNLYPIESFLALVAQVCHSRAYSVCCLLSALEALLDVFFLELLCS